MVFLSKDLASFISKRQAKTGVVVWFSQRLEPIVSNLKAVWCEGIFCSAGGYDVLFGLCVSSLSPIKIHPNLSL